MVNGFEPALLIMFVAVVSQKHLFASGIDLHVLSEGRQWQVLRNRDTPFMANHCLACRGRIPA
jgi:hypothetical protein